ncbi:hypothetical protein HPB48_020748 [Haemaphysalis longicornis]|uniref:Uncharacterized protein n=1 Tax=Haemaphysalis longicornis TaxID=44386 RepID=A0A9J6GS18_HAELO|nr:hypothetical protein HPB48_020748 [Haemaphysalis longicornis]
MCGGNAFAASGLRTDEKGTNTVTIQALYNAAVQTGKLIARIANKHHGLKEHYLLRLVQAFIISKATYVTSYLKLKKAEKDKIERIIRETTKAAVGIPMAAFTEELLEMGIHNTLDEHIEAQRIAQYNRLAGTPTGRTVLKSLHIPYADENGTKDTFEEDLRAQISLAPLPRSMHPEYHQDRRLPRAKVLHKQYSSYPAVCYVDTVDYPGKRAVLTVVVDQHGNATSSCSIPTSNPETGEEVTIALAITRMQAPTIPSDSKAALRHYACGRISTTAAKIPQFQGTSAWYGRQLTHPSRGTGWHAKQSRNGGNESGPRELVGCALHVSEAIRQE